MKQGVVIGILAVAALWLISLIWGLAWKAEVAVREETDARNQYEALEARKSTLEANLAELETPRGKDGAIRTAFDVAKPGEEVIVVMPAGSTTASTTRGFWSRMWRWF